MTQIEYEPAQLIEMGAGYLRDLDLEFLLSKNEEDKEPINAGSETRDGQESPEYFLLDDKCRSGALPMLIGMTAMREKNDSRYLAMKSAVRKSVASHLLKNGSVIDPEILARLNAIVEQDTQTTV